MTRALVVLSLLASTSASGLNAQAPTKGATKQDPKTTVPATKSATPPVTKTAAPDPKGASASKTAAAPATPASADTKTKSVAPADTKTKASGAAQGGGQPGLAVAPEAAQRQRAPVIMREIFAYDSEGRRDPFFSLLATNELRPTVSDLRIVGITYDPSGRRSIVTLRDILTNTRYNVTTGTTLGRMKVVLIKPKAIFFSIEEFGLNRQDSLVLGDTSKVRIK